MPTLRAPFSGLLEFPDSLSRETVWKIAEGFLIALVWWLEGTKLDHFALIWPLATPQIEAYSDFPDSLSTLLSE